MRFRKAQKPDVFSVLKLFQKSMVSQKPDPMFLDYRRLEKSILSENNIWMLTEIDGEIRAGIFLSFDWLHGLCKISRMLVDPSADSPKAVLRETLRYVLHFLENHLVDIDLVYTTTLSMSLEQQNLTIEEGFKTLGIFPNAGGEDQTRMNGLTAFYFHRSLIEKRYKNFKVHPAIEPFYEISRRQCDLPALDKDDFRIDTPDFEKAPALEIIRAEKFSQRRFQNLRENQSQILNFYPFYEPNTLICDPEQQIEVFVKISESNGFAAIIGEHLARNVNPVELYNSVQEILKQANVNYIEIINDASDTFGIECFLKSGFTPCAYFPAFKRQGTTRRDYVVFGKSFGYLCRPPLNLNKAYDEFYREYFKIEGKNYFPNML